jgi:hypothetical protein
MTEKELWEICDKDCAHNTMLNEGWHIQGCKAYNVIKQGTAKQVDNDSASR